MQMGGRVSPQADPLSFRTPAPAAPEDTPRQLPHRRREIPRPTRPSTHPARSVVRSGVGHMTNEVNALIGLSESARGVHSLPARDLLHLFNADGEMKERR